MKFCLLLLQLLLVCFMLASCKKPGLEFPSKGVLLGYDKSGTCKGQLFIRVDASLSGLVAAGFPDSNNFPVMSYPSSFVVDTNSVFPIVVILDYNWGTALCGKDSSVVIKKMERATK